jgi:hypothetical protein
MDREKDVGREGHGGYIQRNILRVELWVGGARVLSEWYGGMVSCNNFSAESACVKEEGGNQSKVYIRMWVSRYQIGRIQQDHAV